MKKKVRTRARARVATPEVRAPAPRRDPLGGGEEEAARLTARRPEKAESITSRLRREVQANASGSRKVFFPPKAGSHKIIRPLTELQENEGGPLDPVVVTLHDDYDAEIRLEPCGKTFGKACGFCKQGIKTWDFYVFTVYDHRSARRMLWPMKTTGYSPLAGFIQAMEKFGTIRDRDYKVRRDPQDTKQVIIISAKNASPFEGKERKPYTEDQVYAILQEESEAAKIRRAAKDKSDQEFDGGGPGKGQFDNGEADPGEDGGQF